MSKVKKKSRVTASVAMRENAKRDNSPKWDGCENWTAEQFNTYYHDSMRYYRIDNTKDLKPGVINWMSRHGYTKDQIQEFKNTKDWRCSNAMGAIAANLLKGMPEVREDFNNGRSLVEWLKEMIATVISDGSNDRAEDSSDNTVKVTAAPVLNIQERIREQAGNMCEELDIAIDSFIENPEAFDPKSIKIASLLRNKGAKAAQARYIKGFYEFDYNLVKEYLERPDDQLKEAYKKFGKKNAKKLAEFYEGIMLACDQLASEAKLLKKPRKKKIKPAEEIVKKLKFRNIDDKLGIVSVPPTSIIGAESLFVYNTKNRKIGLYIAKSSEGFGVKGTSITNFTTTSRQKTLRKPADQLKEFKEQNTKNRAESWFNKIKATDTVCNGRMNADIVILKVFK
jgi:hypothetical protein